MADSVLPASRLEALFVVAPAALSAFFGAAPKTSSAVAKWSTVGANIYAIGTSIVTLLDINDDASELYEDAATVLYILVSTTILTSACIILGVLARIHINNWVVYMSCAASTLGIVGGLYFLYHFFKVACLDDGGTSALCDHRQLTVVLVFVSIGVAGLLLCIGLVTLLKKTESRGENVYEDAELPLAGCGGEGEAMVQPPAVALMSRVSAVSKAVVFGAFWFLVDSAMVWGDGTGQGAFWWVTGQVVKHVSALANNGLNDC